MKEKKKQIVDGPEPGSPPAWEPHAHACDCGRVWFHDPVTSMDIANELPEEEGIALLRKAHTCPDCKTEVHWTSPKTPTLLHDGIHCEPLTFVPKVKDDDERKFKRFLMMLHVKGQI